ncbi:MAG: bifunctional protein-serine/threonine kinase/phosphatase [Pseudomonadota bacterium]|nr:bifunctional protein-serine/threonine kinase/phosphatase [Pseudomonadota bacterium]MDP1903709.1 bifunctional protein-serine/threonine kinase/phosphatase [Pseudomonadota bacterium]MDP2351232.1 bifunctional protein-serine/threonine kinase/phosphatase [Pseudomonadota bacterium]
MQLSFGYASEIGPRPRNEDFGGFTTPAAATVAVKGYLAALADGVSGGSHGREAAESTVRNLLADYYATPDTWEVAHALDTVIQSLNRWLSGQVASRREAGGMACTLSALVLRGRRWHLAHVGDTRIYRLRGEHLEQLTQDHTWEQPGMEHVLKRAVGLDTHLRVDYAEGDLAAGDVFLIVCDGVWQALGQVELHRLLKRYDDADVCARNLVAEALRQGGGDNASALVARVHGLAAVEDEKTELIAGRHLPLPGRLSVGARLDGFIIDEVLHDSRETLLYRARARESGQTCVLKTLQARLVGDTELAEQLLMEEWLGKRVQSPYFPQVLPLPARNFLYFAMSWHAGRSLQAMLDHGHHFGIQETISIGIRLLKGLGALHRLDVVHRDVKPANLHQGEDGKLRILDLGVARSPARAEELAAGNPGTPSFLAPELFTGATAESGTDLYAAGVTLYHLLTRHYPYGEIEAFQHPRFGEPVPPSRYRPDIPGWMEIALLKACARSPEERFETAEEFLLALERGAANRLARPRPMPLAARDPLRLWQSVALIALVFNLLFIYLLLAG